MSQDQMTSLLQDGDSASSTWKHLDSVRSSRKPLFSERMIQVARTVFDTYTAELLRRADLTLAGRVSFQLFNSFWPEVAKDPTSEKWTPEQRELSQAGASVPTIVVSDTLTGNWPDISIIRRADAHQKIAELKRQPGKDILITGSRTLWNDLLVHDLIDEIHLMIGYVVLGEGVPIFVGKPPASLRLIDVRTWEHSDNVLLRYAVRRTGVETT